MRLLSLLALAALAACASAPTPGVTVADSPTTEDPVGDDFTVVLPELHQAAMDGDLTEANRLIEAGADVNAFAQVAPPPGAVVAPLHLAAAGGHEAMVTRLLDAGADADARSAFFGSPLTIAAVDDANLPAIRHLLDAGVNPDAANGELEAPLHRAVSNAAAGIVAALLDAGADSTLQDDSGQTPLDLAQEWGHEAIIVLLATRGQ